MFVVASTATDWISAAAACVAATTGLMQVGAAKQYKKTSN
jgi:hypothetical protein